MSDWLKEKVDEEIREAMAKRCRIEGHRWHKLLIPSAQWDWFESCMWCNAPKPEEK